LQAHTGEYLAFGVLGGGAPLTGGFNLVSPSTHKSVDFHAADFHFLPVATDGPGGAPEGDYLFISGHDDRPGSDFVVRSPKIHLDLAGGSPYTPDDNTPHAPPALNVTAWALVARADLAAKRDRPDPAGRVLGDGELLATAQPFGGPWSYPPGLNAITATGGGNSPPPSTSDAGLDIQLATLGAITPKVHSG